MANTFLHKTLDTIVDINSKFYFIPSMPAKVDQNNQTKIGKVVGYVGLCTQLIGYSLVPQAVLLPIATNVYSTFKELRDNNRS